MENCFDVVAIGIEDKAAALYKKERGGHVGSMGIGDSRLGAAKNRTAIRATRTGQP